MDVNKLAHEIHRRRSAMNPNAPRHAAAGIARFCEEYGLEPTLDDFDPYLDLLVKVGDETMTLVSSSHPAWEVTEAMANRVTYVVFTLGEKLSETEVAGWLPARRTLAAPIAARHGREVARTVDSRCIYPPPMVLDFEKHLGFVEPELDVPGVWDYDLQALWTPLGFCIYDYDIARTVAQADRGLK